MIVCKHMVKHYIIKNINKIMKQIVIKIKTHFIKIIKYVKIQLN